MILLGSVINFATILVGGIVGTLLHRGIPERITKSILCGMALCVIYIGIDGLHIGDDGMNALVVVLSVGIGAALGEILNIDGAMTRFGSFLERKFKRGDGEGKLGEAFVSATILFCVGAMAINGSLMSAQGDHSILIAKSVIDGITCLVMATTLGIGCVLSAIPTFVYQGGLTVIFYAVLSHLDKTSAMCSAVVGHMGCVGSLVIIAIGLNMLGVTKIKTADFIPAMFMPVLICPLFGLIGLI